MLCGIPPFYSENVERMYELIKLAELKFPKKINTSPDAQNIIIKLLDRNPTTRLGAKGGIAEIKAHPFFASIDFDLVHKKRLNAPFKPVIEDKYDVQNFDEEFTTEEIAQSMIPEKNLELIKKNQDKFRDFNKK
jgi:serine/threonine protein kinase